MRNDEDCLPSKDSKKWKKEDIKERIIIMVEQCSWFQKELKEKLQKKKRRKKKEIEAAKFKSSKGKPGIFFKNGQLHGLFDFLTWVVNILVFCYIYKNSPNRNSYR